MALKKEQMSLKKWSNQKWRTSDGSESKGKKRYLPDRAWDALSPQEKAATNRAKSEGNEKGKQFVAQPRKIAKKTARYRKINEELVLRIRHLAKDNPEIHAIDADNQDLFSFRKYERAEEVIPALVEEAGAAAGGATGGAATSGGTSTGTTGDGSSGSGETSGGDTSAEAPSEGEGSGDQESGTKENQVKASRTRYYHIPGYRTGFVSPMPFVKFTKKKKKKKDEEDKAVNERYVINEAKASDIKGTGRVAQLAREYLEKYPTKFTFRANKHVEVLEKYLGKRADEVVKVVIGGYFMYTYNGLQWTGTATVAFTEDKIFVAQKGLFFGTENVKTINRDKIDDVEISRGVIYGTFAIHARSEHLMIGVIHKSALEDLQEFLEKYADAKIRIKQSQEPDQLSKQVVNESLVESISNLSEELFAVEFEKMPGEVHSETIEADDEDEAITKAIEEFEVDVENIKSIEQILEEVDAEIRAEILQEVNIERRAKRLRKSYDPDAMAADMSRKLSIPKAIFGLLATAFFTLATGSPYQIMSKAKNLAPVDKKKLEKVLSIVRSNPEIGRVVSQVRAELAKEDPDKTVLRALKKEFTALVKQLLSKKAANQPEMAAVTEAVGDDLMDNLEEEDEDEEDDSEEVWLKRLEQHKKFKTPIEKIDAEYKSFKKGEKLPDDRVVPQEEIERSEKLRRDMDAYGKQRMAGIKGNTPFIDDYGGSDGKLWMVDPATGRRFVKVLPIDPATGKRMEMSEFIKQPDWNQPEPEGVSDPKTGKILVGRDGKPLLNSAPAGDARLSNLNEAGKRHPLLVKHGVEGFNKPKRTPGHKTKSHMVVAKKGDKIKVVRFGAQGAKGSPAKEGETEKWRKRRQNWVKRHKAQNPGAFKNKLSALYWANKVKW